MKKIKVRHGETTLKSICLILSLVFFAPSFAFCLSELTQKQIKDNKTIRPKFEVTPGKTISWFVNRNCHERTLLQLNFFEKAKDVKPKQHKIIEDQVLIERLKIMIEKYPLTAKSKNGELIEYQDIAITNETPVVELEFICSSEAEKIKFYNGRLKNPFKGFYKVQTDDEIELFKFLEFLQTQ